MQRKQYQFRIDKNGEVFAEVMGVPGTSCVQELEKLQVAIGGQKLSEGNTDDYYKPPMGEPVFERNGNN